MAIDKVKPLKLETTVDGSVLDPSPTETNPTSDYLAAKGIAFQDSNTIFADSDGTNIRFQDAVQTTPITLTGLTLAPNFFFAENTATQNTTSTSAINALSLTVNTALPAGKYYMAFHFQWSNSAAGNITTVNTYINIGGVPTTVANMSARPANSANIETSAPWKVITLTAQAANNVVLKIDFFTNGGTASVKECRILFYRIQ